MENNDGPVVLLSGGPATRPLVEPLTEHCHVAIFDAGVFNEMKPQVEALMCPATGARPQLQVKAANDAAFLTSHVVTALPEMATLHRNGTGPDGTEPDSWLPALVMNVTAALAFDLRVLEAFCELFDVRCVVTHEDVTPRFKALALFAKSQGIPAIHIPHANHFIQVRPDVHDTSICDWMLARSGWMRDWYVARGYPRRRIQVVGSPALDRWEKVRRKISREHARAVLDLKDDETVVLYCTSWPQTTNLVDDHSAKAKADVAMLEAARANGWRLIWSLHPGDRPEWQQNYAELSRQHNVPALVVRGHLPYTARAADVVVTIGPSNVLVEGALAGVPPVTIPLRGYDYPATPPWRARPTVKSIGDTVRRVLENPVAWENSREQFIKRFAYQSDGKATERAVAAILKIAGIEGESGDDGSV